MWPVTRAAFCTSPFTRSRSFANSCSGVHFALAVTQSKSCILKILRDLAAVRALRPPRSIGTLRWVIQSGPMGRREEELLGFRVLLALGGFAAGVAVRGGRITNGGCTESHVG